jgi:hypothetical protein
MFAPYKDMGLDQNSLVTLATTYNLKAITAAFIQVSMPIAACGTGGPYAGCNTSNQSTCPVATPVTCSAGFSPTCINAQAFCIPNSSSDIIPSWAGKPLDNTTILGIIKDYINSSGKLIISQGGAIGTSLAQAYYLMIGGSYTQQNAIADLTTQYVNIIKLYSGLYGLDFDIEGTAQTDGSFNILIPALRNIKISYPELPISFTLPVLPTGLTSSALPIVKAVADEAVSSKASPVVDLYNLMTMDFGESWVNSNGAIGDMGQWSTEALSATLIQINAIYGNNSLTPITYANLGCTPMIGVNDSISSGSQQEIFKIADATTVLNFANQNNLGLIAMWDLQRDAIDSTAKGEDSWKAVSNTNSGTNNKTGAYSDVFNQISPTPAATGSLAITIDGPSGMPLPGPLTVGGATFSFAALGTAVSASVSIDTYTISAPSIQGYTPSQASFSVQVTAAGPNNLIISYVAAAALVCSYQTAGSDTDVILIVTSSGNSSQAVPWTAEIGCSENSCAAAALKCSALGALTPGPSNMALSVSSSATYLDITSSSANGVWITDVTGGAASITSVTVNGTACSAN